MTNTDLPNPDDFVLVLSVGGSPEPLIKSIQHYHPLNVIFIASKESKAKILQIIKETDGIEKYATIVISDHQDLLACVRDIRLQIPAAIAEMKLPENDLLIADITGGTKVMSSALTLAMMEFNSRFTYVGGDKRPKNNDKADNTGPVQTGSEVIMPMDNPWDAIGLREANSLVLAFNAGQFEAAREMADFIKSKDSEYAAFYDGLSYIIEAYRNWDIFNHKLAYSQLVQGIKKLNSYSTRNNPRFQALYGQFLQAQKTLEDIEREAVVLKKAFEPLEAGFGDAYLRDLVGNARRRAKRGRYDDAVARLYSAIEKTAKIALAQKGINNSDVSREALYKAGEDLAAKYADQSGGKIGIPLGDSFQLMCRLEPDHQVSCAYTLHQENLEKTLEFRNQSLLAHGYRTVKADDYQKLFDITLQFLDISEEDLPDFPELEVNSILF